jgi:hypothetical protein
LGIYLHQAHILLIHGALRRRPFGKIFGAALISAHAISPEAHEISQDFRVLAKLVVRVYVTSAGCKLKHVERSRLFAHFSGETLRVIYLAVTLILFGQYELALRWKLKPCNIAVASVDEG